MAKVREGIRDDQPLPLATDRLLEQEFERIRAHLPKDLFSLKSSQSLTFLDQATDFRPERAFRQVDGADGGWQVRPGVDFVHGLLGKTGERLSHAEVTRAGTHIANVAPHRPEWAELVPSPRLSVLEESERLQRIDGRRIRPHGYVFGSDDRRPFYPSGYPWQCIGKLLVWTNPTSPSPQSTGTAALVGPNLILTAGHMAPWGADPWMVQFIPAFYNGASILGPSVYSYVEHYRGNSGGESKAWDHALMKLYDPLGSSIGWLGSRSYNDNWNSNNVWTLVGYPGAVANAQQPSWQGSISFHDDDEDGDAMELETNNGDSSPGDSGGPFFAHWDDGPHIVGVDSGGEEEYQFPFSSQDNNIAAGGKALVDLVKWGYANWT